jgi:hypothetical protein
LTPYCPHKFLEFTFNGPVDPNTGLAPGVYMATNEAGFLDPVVECVFEHHLATPFVYAALVSSQQHIHGECECHLDGQQEMGGAAGGENLEPHGENEDAMLSADEAFGTIAMLQRREHLRHPLVVAGSRLEQFLDETHAHDLSGDRLMGCV